MASFKFSLSIPRVRTDWWKKSRNELNSLVQDYNRQNWPSQKDPVTGQGWQPRKQPTGNWPLLNRTGKMFNTTQFQTSASQPMIFAARTVDYGPFQQYGTSRMPARRWLGIGGNLPDQMAKVIGKNIFSGRNIVIRISS